MTCEKCKTKSLRNEMCRKCFTLWFEKKIRKEIRESNLKKNEEINIKDTKDINFSVLKYLLEKVIHIPLTFSDKGKEIFPSSMEDKAKELLKGFFEKKKNKGGIHLMKTVNQEDIETYAEIKSIKGKKRLYDDEISEMIKDWDKELHNIKTSLAKAQETLKDL